MKKSKKIIAILLLISIMFIMVPNSAFAGVFDTIVAKTITNVFEPVAKWLGMVSFRELVFNEQINPSTNKAEPRKDLNYGFIQKNQSKTLFKAHFFFVFWSLFMLIAASIWMFTKKAISVTIPAIRASLKMDLLYFILSFFVISFLIPLFLLGLEMTQVGVNIFNNELTKSFFDGTLSPDSSVLGDMGNALTRLFIFGLSIYLNVIYLIRQKVIVILFIISPVLVPLLMWDSTRNAAITGLKEIISQLMVPVVHAFFFWIFAVLFPVSSNLDKLVMLSLFVPFSEWIRTMLFGSSHMSKISGALGLATMGALGAAAFKGSKALSSSKVPSDVGQGSQSHKTSNNGGSTMGSGSSIGHKVRQAVVGTAKVGAQVGTKAVGASIGAGMMAGAGPGGMVAGAAGGWSATGTAINKTVGAAHHGVKNMVQAKRNQATERQTQTAMRRDKRVNTVAEGRLSNLENARAEYQDASITYGSDSIQALSAKNRLSTAEQKHNKSSQSLWTLSNAGTSSRVNQQTSSTILPNKKTTTNHDVIAKQNNQIHTSQNVSVNEETSYITDYKATPNKRRTVSEHNLNRNSPNFETVAGHAIIGIK